MLSRRALFVVSVAAVSLIFLAASSRKLGVGEGWTFESSGYTHLIPGAFRHDQQDHRPQDDNHGAHPENHSQKTEKDDQQALPHMNPVNNPYSTFHSSQLDQPSGAPASYLPVSAPPSSMEPSTAATDASTMSTFAPVNGLPATEDQPYRPHDPVCDSFPDTSSLLIVMKTGATESRQRIPTQLMTMLRCVPEFFIFSDLDEKINGYRVRDSLDMVLAETKKDNADFDLYNRQKECAVDQESCNKMSDKQGEGWNLDKYKNVHIAEKVYWLRPKYDWYVFVDADTYVLFPTLVEWLKQLDPKKPLYLGSMTMLAGYAFAHGGSGYVVSQATMSGFGNHKGISNRLEPEMRTTCCGDYMFAKSAENVSDTRPQNTWPTINGEKPFTMPYSGNHWCHPLATMHHLNSEEISSFWEWQNERARTHPNTITRIKDVYEHFMAPVLVDSRDDWDNLSDDRFYLRKNSTTRNYEDWERDRVKNEDEPLTEKEKRAHESFEACRAACEENEGCFQFRWQDELCGWSWSFRMGNPKKKEGDEERKRWKSGWDKKKIEKFIQAQGDCGGQHIQWPYVET